MFADGWDEGVMAVSEARGHGGPGMATARRRVLGEAGGLCAARRVDSDEDCILCALGVGHFDLDDQAPFKDGKPGWRRAGASIWNGSGAVCIPHAAI